MSGIESIAAERRRQIEAEGWTPEHDDEHCVGELAAAAASYALARNECDSALVSWPWAMKWWKPKDTRSNLVRAGALIAAELDRLDRKSPILNAAPPVSEEPTKEELRMHRMLGSIEAHRRQVATLTAALARIHATRVAVFKAPWTMPGEDGSAWGTETQAAIHAHRDALDAIPTLLPGLEPFPPTTPPPATAPANPQEP